MLIEALFYVFGAVLIGAALAVISARNPVYSALALVTCFITSAAIWLLIEAEFLAVVLVLVYVGAVMVLFLFVVMMPRRQPGGAAPGIHPLRLARLAHGPGGDRGDRGVVWRAVDSASTPAAVQRPRRRPTATRSNSGACCIPDTRTRSNSQPCCCWWRSAAIALTMRRRPGLKKQDVSAQVAVRRADRLRIVQMDAEKRP